MKFTDITLIILIFLLYLNCMSSSKKELSKSEIAEIVMVTANEECYKKFNTRPFVLKNINIDNLDTIWNLELVERKGPNIFTAHVSGNGFTYKPNVNIEFKRLGCRKKVDFGRYDYDNKPFSLLEEFEAIVEFDTCDEIQRIIEFYYKTGYKTLIDMLKDSTIRDIQPPPEALL